MGCTEAPVGREIRRVGLALVQTDCADGEKRVTPETQTMEEHRGKEALRFCRRNTMMRSRPVPSWLCATRMKSTHQPGAVALAIACHLALAPSEMHGYWRLAWTGRGSGPDELLPFYAHPGRIYTNSLQFHLRNYRQLVLELAQPQRVTPPAGKESGQWSRASSGIFAYSCPEFHKISGKTHLADFQKNDVL